MKILYVYAFLILATKIAVADNFNDLWKKHGGEVLSGNKTNSITKDVDTYRLNKAEREAEILRKKINTNNLVLTGHTYLCFVSTNYTLSHHISLGLQWYSTI